LSKIRVLLIEDNRLLREGIEAMLNEQPDIKALSAAGNGDAFEKAESEPCSHQRAAPPSRRNPGETSSWRKTQRTG